MVAVFTWWGLFGIFLYKIWADVGVFALDFDIVEVYGTGVSDVEAAGGQRAPHGGFGILGGFLVTEGGVDTGELCCCYAAALVYGYVADVNVFDRMAGQSGYGTAVVAAVCCVYVVDVYAPYAAHGFYAVGLLSFSSAFVSAL